MVPLAITPSPGTHLTPRKPLLPLTLSPSISASPSHSLPLSSSSRHPFPSLPCLWLPLTLHFSPLHLQQYSLSVSPPLVSQHLSTPPPSPLSIFFPSRPLPLLFQHFSLFIPFLILVTSHLCRPFLEATLVSCLPFVPDRSLSLYTVPSISLTASSFQ